MSLKTQLESLKESTFEKIITSENLKALNDIRVNTLGKKGPITEVLRGMKDLSAEERPKVGSFANEIRDFLESYIVTLVDKYCAINEVCAPAYQNTKSRISSFFRFAS